MTPRRVFQLLHRLAAVLIILSILLSYFPVEASAPRFESPQSAASPLQTVDPAQTTAASIASAPLSLARVQSAYVAGTTTITFIATNNLPPTILPELPDTATFTETIDTLSAFEASDDANILKNVTLEDTLAAGTTLVAASGDPIQSGSDLTWQLGDIPPLGSATVTMTVQTPAAGGNFLDLDSGAQVSAEMWGEAVSAGAPPAVIVPNSIPAAYTQATPDADIFDADMLWKSAQLGQDPIAMFELARGFSNDAYPGSLRGTRGMLWGEAGSSADKSSLLIAMLRAAGLPARYRHGTLSDAQARSLLGSMFPPQSGVAGYLPAGTQTADPINDAALIAMVSDHWWVQANLPGQGWTDFDPSFQDAGPGDTFATPLSDGTDQIADLPASMDYNLHLELEVEQYNQFPIGGVNLTKFVPLAVDYTLAQLAAKALTVGHIAVTEGGGGVFTTITHTYTPFFAPAGEESLTAGDEFQDILTNFPLGSKFTTAEWLHVTLTSPDGREESFTRGLKDLIGLDARLFGGNPVIALPADNRAFTSFDDAFATWFLPNQVRDTHYATRQQAENGRAVIAAALAANDLPDPLVTPTDRQLFREGILKYYLARNQQYAIAGLEFAKMADPAMRDIEANLRVKLYYDQPRIIITSSAEQEDGGIETSIDLRSTRAAAIVYPGQATDALFSAQWTKGIVESYYETEVAARLAGAIPASTARLFDEMHALGIQPLLVTPETMDLLDLFYTDRQSVAYARQALLEGKHILIPPAPVTLDGEPLVGWWEIDPQTGETISVLENGQHTAALETIIFLLEFWDTLDDAGDLQKVVADMWTCIAESVVPALQGNPVAPRDCLEGFEIPNTAWPPWYPDPLDYFKAAQNQAAAAGEPLSPGSPQAASSWRYLPAHLCTVDNCGIEQFVLPYSDRSPIPLPEMLFGYNDRFGGEDQEGVQFSVVDNGDPGPDAISLATTPASSSVLPGEIHTFELRAEANFAGELRAWVYAPDGWQVRFNDTGVVETAPLMGTPPGDYSLQIIAQSVDDPDVIATAEHPVTIPDSNQLLLAAGPEPNISLPSGDPAFGAVSNQTNDGESEYPDSAFRLVIANYSGIAKNLTLTASGAPAGWLILDGARQTSSTFELGANQRTQVGLYVLPESTPAPGTSFVINIQLSDGQGLVENAAIPWSMPGQAHSYLQVSPGNLYVGTDSSTAFDITLENVGNASGSFPLAAVLPVANASVGNLPAPVSLAAGEVQSFTANLSTSGVPLGMRFPLTLSSPSPESYTQYAVSMVQIVSPLTEPVFQAADQMAGVCTTDVPGLAPAVQALAVAMARLEDSCLSGSCSLDLRDQVVSAANTAAFHAGNVSPVVTQDENLEGIAVALASHTSNDDILADLADLSAAVASTTPPSLLDEICVLTQHMPALSWTPAYSATLTGQPVLYSLELTNQGSLPTSYALTVTLPGGVQSFSPALDAGESTSLPFPVDLGTLGLYELDTEVSVVGESWIQVGATARLNVVDRFVQVNSVTPDPPFVETGVSSTDISVNVSNVANIALPANVHTEILSPQGDIAFSGDLPLTVLAGAPRSYPLHTVDTSGWTAGVYTVTVDLLNASGTALLPDGSGYGYLGVGQALGISHALSPLVVNPGTVEVTTLITAEVLAPVIIPETAGQPLEYGQLRIGSEAAAPAPLALPPAAPLTTDAITRTDDLDAAIVYTGAWTHVTTPAWTRHVSQGSYSVSDAAGDTATFAFDGTWVHIGFGTDRFGGQAEILVDGVSQGTVDTYSHEIDVASIVFNGLADTAHTLTISVLGTAHPNAVGQEVKLDYIDTWDGTPFPDGLVEQDSSRVWRSPDWTDVADVDASGGSYMQNNISGSAWFPFTGDSLTLLAFANSSGNRISIAIDGVWQTNYNIYNSTDITRTVSFDDLGTGPHVMQVRRYYNSAQVDAFITPAIEPGYVPPAYSGIVRYEADDPAILYNGYPWRVMPQSWSTDILPNASDSTVVQSTTLSDTISLTFDGRWVSIGVRARPNSGGYGEVFIDGASYGLIDSLSTVEELRSFEFGGLITGTHTLDIVVLDQPNPLNNIVYLDYIDVWDGTPMPDDLANAHKAQDSGRLHYSVSGVDAAHPNAFQGDFVASGLPNTNSNVWYSFTGDSFTFYGLSVDNDANQEIYLDGDLIDTVNLDYPFSEQVLAFHYTGFDDGPHVVRVHNIWRMRVDGFTSNPGSLTPFQPIVEWHESDQTRGGSIWGGIHVPIAVGDVTPDPGPELVVASSNIQSNGELFVLRGDGGDTGDGDPIIWSVPYNIFNGFEDVASPAIAELDSQPGAEIIHPTIEGLFVYHSDGSTYWMTDTVHSHAFFAAAAVGNLDFDAEPEIVVNMNHDLVVFEPDGEIAWLQTFPAALSMPVLADLNGDGLLDILVHESGTTNIYAYEYNFGTPTLLWNQTAASQLHIYGGPAVVDVDGMQPGGDALPEVAIASQGWLNVFNGEDGSLLWALQLDDGRSGGISAADLDGDGEIELVTSMEFDGGRIYAINPDQTILWSVTALDNSPLNTSVMDLNDDGLYEVAWNGAPGGFTLFNGPDGAVLFNEPHLEIVSQTGSDFPMFADVDQDGYGEVVVASQTGVRVFGFDGVWGPARSTWNQHSYHITNINDDLSVPFSEPDSWSVHNTYRTQTTLTNPLPVYSIELTHTVGSDGVTVLPGTFNIPPDSQSGLDYRWDFAIDWETTQVIHSFNSQLDDMQPGESRLVAQGTQASYTLASGQNHLALPPLYASAGHLITIDPPLRVAGPGGVVEYTLTITNPTDQAVTFQLNAAGLPGDWISLPTPVDVPAQSNASVQLVVSIPQGVQPSSLPFNVTAESAGLNDQASATLVVTDPLVAAHIVPPERSAPTGDPVAYTLTITNLESIARTYDLSVSGLAAHDLPAQVSLDSGQSTDLDFNAQAANEGANPFTVQVAETHGFGGAQATAVLNGMGYPQVEVAISPASASSGPGVPSLFDVTVTNLGVRPELFDLTTGVPQGWDSLLTLLGSPAGSVLVGPGVGAAVTLQLLVTPDAGSAPGDYAITAAAQSTTSSASDSAAAILNVGRRGVVVEFISGPAELAPDASGTWQVQVTNTGAAADSFDLSAFGVWASSAQITPGSVSLGAGQSQTVQLSAGPLSYALTQGHVLGILAESVSDADIRSQATTLVGILAQEGVEVELAPAAQTVSGSLTGSFTLAITNTGNLATDFTITGSVTAGGVVSFPASSLVIPARSAAVMLADVTVPCGGEYEISVTVQGGQAEDNASAALNVIYPCEPPKMFLPLVMTGAPGR